MKSLIILGEAIVVGVCLLIIVRVFEFTYLPNWLVLILSGMFFHILFEYTGLNKMYVDSYYSKFKVSGG